MAIHGVIKVITSDLTALCVVGFDETKPAEVNRSELERLVNSPGGVHSTMWRGTFYCETSGDFHFLRLHLKIKTSELPIVAIGQHPLEKSKWVEISSLVLTNR